MTDRLKKPFEVLWDIVLLLSFLLLFPELTGLCFKLWSKMHQIISLPMVEVQKQHREGSADAGRWDLHKLWHCGLRFPLCLCEFMRGKSTPSFGLHFWISPKVSERRQILPAVPKGHPVDLSTGI